MRFRDFLRVSVILFGGAATALAVVSVAGAARADTNTLVYVAAIWWCLATLAGLWLGRRLAPTPGIAELLVAARKTNALPELEPGTVLFNRLWGLIVLTISAAVIGFWFPQVPAIATGYLPACRARLAAPVRGRRGDRAPRRGRVLVRPHLAARQAAAAAAAGPAQDRGNSNRGQV